jgi:hypothetical protein
MNDIGFLRAYLGQSLCADLAGDYDVSFFQEESISIYVVIILNKILGPMCVAYLNKGKQPLNFLSAATSVNENMYRGL